MEIFQICPAKRRTSGMMKRGSLEETNEDLPASNTDGFLCENPAQAAVHTCLQLRMGMGIGIKHGHGHGHGQWAWASTERRSGERRPDQIGSTTRDISGVDNTPEIEERKR